jgi:transcriptional regulator with XRE-family HTH domain
MARRHRGWTQGELARRISTTQSAVSRWERGHEEPRLSTLQRILAECGLQAMLSVDDGVDRTQIRARLALSPIERLGKVADAHSMATAHAG